MEYKFLATIGKVCKTNHFYNHSQIKLLQAHPKLLSAHAQGLENPLIQPSGQHVQPAAGGGEVSGGVVRFPQEGQGLEEVGRVRSHIASVFGKSGSRLRIVQQAKGGKEGVRTKKR